MSKYTDLDVLRELARSSHRSSAYPGKLPTAMVRHAHWLVELGLLTSLPLSERYPGESRFRWVEFRFTKSGLALLRKRKADPDGH